MNSCCRWVVWSLGAVLSACGVEAPGSDADPAQDEWSSSSDADGPLEDPEVGAASRQPPGGGDDDFCAGVGESCSTPSDCCVPIEGALVCVAAIVDDGVIASCREACADDDECGSGCCVRLHDGTGACGDASECTHACLPLLAGCEAGEDPQGDACCEGAVCEAGACTMGCASDDACPSGCCGPDGRCTQAEACGRVDRCDDGAYFCSAGSTLLECDGDAWYPVDCETACIEAGWAGSSGCAWSLLAEGDACACHDDG